MGLKLSSLFAKKKTKKQKKVEYSPRTAEELYNARRTAKLIYPPLSSIPKEEPKRFVRPDGRPLYESIHVDWEFDENDRKYESERHRDPSHFGNYYNQYDDGIFSVLSQQPMNRCNIFRI